MKITKAPIPAFKVVHHHGDSQNDFGNGLGGTEGLLKHPNRANVVDFAASERRLPFDEAGAELAKPT